MQTVGSLLREIRLSSGYELPDVARLLRIRLPYLEAIESDRYDALPGPAYVLGFLRSYGEFLGFDPEQVVRLYREQTDTTSLPTEPLNFPIRIPESRIPRGAIIVLSLVLALVAIYGGSRLLNDEPLSEVDRVATVPERLVAGAPAGTAPPPGRLQDPSSAFAAVTPQPGGTPPVTAPAGTTLLPGAAGPGQPQPALPAQAQMAALPAIPPPQPPVRSTSSIDRDIALAALPGAERKETTPVLPRQREIVAVARVDSWIEVRDLNNQPLASLLLRVGDTYRLPEGANYRLITGDLRGLEIRVDGRTVSQGVGNDRVHRILSLDAGRLSAGQGVLD